MADLGLSLGSASGTSCYPRCCQPEIPLPRLRELSAPERRGGDGVCSAVKSSVMQTHGRRVEQTASKSPCTAEPGTPQSCDI